MPEGAHSFTFPFVKKSLYYLSILFQRFNSRRENNIQVINKKESKEKNNKLFIDHERKEPSARV